MLTATDGRCRSIPNGCPRLPSLVVYSVTRREHSPCNHPRLSRSKRESFRNWTVYKGQVVVSDYMVNHDERPAMSVTSCLPCVRRVPQVQRRIFTRSKLHMIATTLNIPAHAIA